FASLLTFLQGTTTNWVGTPNRTFLYWRSMQGAWYVQDVIQLRPNLTLRAGLRDEFTNGWNEKYGRAAQYVLDANGVPTSDPLTSATRIGKSTFSDNKATRLLSPRVSFAWDVFGNGKTSMLKLPQLFRGTTPSSSNWRVTCLFASPMLALTATTTLSISTPIPFRSRFAPIRPAARAVVFAPQLHPIRLSWCPRERRTFQR